MRSLYSVSQSSSVASLTHAEMAFVFSQPRISTPSAVSCARHSGRKIRRSRNPRQRLRRVAHRRAADLGADAILNAHRGVGVSVHVHVAHALAGLDCPDGGAPTPSGSAPCRRAGSAVDAAVQPHQLVHASREVPAPAHAALRKPGLPGRPFEHPAQRRLDSMASERPEHDRVPEFRHSAAASTSVGPGIVDDGDHADGHAPLLDPKAARSLKALSVSSTGRAAPRPPEAPLHASMRFSFSVTVRERRALPFSRATVRRGPAGSDQNVDRLFAQKRAAR